MKNFILHSSCLLASLLLALPYSFPQTISSGNTPGTSIPSQHTTLASSTKSSTTNPSSLQTPSQHSPTPYDSNRLASQIDRLITVVESNSKYVETFSSRVSSIYYILAAVLAFYSIGSGIILFYYERKKINIEDKIQGEYDRLQNRNEEKLKYLEIIIEDRVKSGVSTKFKDIATEYATIYSTEASMRYENKLVLYETVINKAWEKIYPSISNKLSDSSDTKKIKEVFVLMNHFNRFKFAVTSLLSNKDNEIYDGLYRLYDFTKNFPIIIPAVLPKLILEMQEQKKLLEPQMLDLLIKISKNMGWDKFDMGTFSMRDTQ